MGASAPTVSANTEFTVTVKVSENTGICWAKAVVKYDSSVLTYVSANTNTSVFKGATITANNPREGEVIVTLGGISVLFQPNPQVYTLTGDFVVLTFKVKDSAKAGTTAISVQTANSDVVKIKDSIPDYSFEIKNASTSVKVTDDKPHTCTPGTATKEHEVAPSCTVDGSYELVTRCTICGNVLSTEKKTVAKLGHTEGETIKENEVPATCISVGKYDSVVKCKVCNLTISTTVVVIPVNEDHIVGSEVKENEKAGDCKTASSYDSVYYCTICNREINRKTVSGAKGAHVAGTPEVKYVDSTCTTKGSITEITKCKVCGIEMNKKTTELELADHIKDKEVRENEIAATCTKAGSYISVYKCKVCKTQLSSEVVTVDKIPHTPAKAVEENRKNPVNCGADGSYDSVVYCSVCTAEISRVKQTIKAPDHTPGAAATDTSPQICTVCNTVLVPAHGHTHKWESALKSDSTGHWYPCSGCSEKKDFAAHNYTNTCDADCDSCGFKRTPGDHAYGNWTTVKEPTATAEGQRERACIICGNKVTESIPATGAPTTTTPPETTVEPDVTTDPAETTTESTPGTDAPGTTEQTPGTTAPEATDPEATDPEATTDPGVEDSGCGSAVSMGIAFIAILGTALIMKKRD